MPSAVGQAILPAAAFQAAFSAMCASSLLGGAGCSQDWVPHKTGGTSGRNLSALEKRLDGEFSGAVAEGFNFDAEFAQDGQQAVGVLGSGRTHAMQVALEASARVAGE